MNGLVLAALPVLTGLQSVLWSQIIGISRPVAAITNVVASLILCAVLCALYWRENPFTAILQGGAAYVIGYLVVNVIVALLWIAALQTSHISVIGFVEIGYPLFILLFGYLFIGSVNMTLTHWAGAALIFVGTSVVVVANHT